jgi:hypothetical protein
LAEFEYIKTIFEVIINGYASNILADKLDLNVKMLLKTDMFRVAIKYLLDFDMNNIYQKLFEQMILVITNKYSSKIIIDHLFVELDILSQLIDKCQNNLRFTFKG